MFYQPNEIVNLLIAIFLTPVMWIGLRDLRVPGKPYFIIGYALMIFAFIVTILEQEPTFPLWNTWNVAEHLSLGVAGVFFALGAFAVWRDARRGGGFQ